MSVVLERGFLNAYRELRAADAATAKRIRAAVNNLEHDPEPPISTSLGGRFRRLHIGQWRILYELDDEGGDKVTVRVWLLGRTGR